MTAITLKTAAAIVEHAIEKARERGFQPLAVAVLDARGQLKAFGSEDGTSLLRAQIAISKAWGALGMGMGGRSLTSRAQKNPAFFTALGAMSEGKMVPAAGSVLIRTAAGELIGAVGISGDLPENDEAAAIAGIEAAGMSADAGE